VEEIAMNVRKLAALVPAVVLGIACTMAQNGDGSNDRSQESKNLIIVEGCLGESVGAYKLTDSAGASYQLTGKTAKLKEHIGQTVRVTATTEPLGNEPGSMSQNTETQPTLSVIGLTQVSGVCTNGANNIP
jgi:hypothetical protein